MQISFSNKQQSSHKGLLCFVKNIFLLFLLVSSSYGTDIDINKLLQVAKNQHKHIMFFHHIPGCPYCKTMLDENFKDVSILKEVHKDFVYVDIFIADNGNVKFKDFKGSYKEFSAYIGAPVYPSTIFMNGDGKVVHKAIGYRNIDEYFAEITYVSTNSYKIMNLEEYVQKLEFEKD